MVGLVPAARGDRRRPHAQLRAVGGLEMGELGVGVPGGVGHAAGGGARRVPHPDLDHHPVTGGHR